MKIGIVLHPYDEDKPAGLARTIFEITKGMVEVDTTNEYIIFLKKKPRQNPNFPGNNWRVKILGGGLLWLNNLKNAEKADIYIFNTPVMPLLYKPTKSIVIGLDFAYYYLGGGKIKGTLLRFVTFVYHFLSLHRSDHIIAISEATKKDIVKLFKISPAKITVIYCGFKKICAVPEKSVVLPEKFFLFIGIVKERKNVFNIVKAFYEFQKKHSDVTLVLGGNASGPYYEKIAAYIKNKDFSDSVVWIGHINDQELSYVYRRALCLVFPALIEGFGFPVLEGMDCGIPVITSNQSSLKEVGGNGSALLVDPYNASDIAGAMERIVTEKGLQEELIQKGFKQAKKFSWHKTAQNMLALIKSLS